MNSSKKVVLKSVWWNSIQLVVSQSFSFLVRLLLAKLLLPAEFGVVGMATLFTGFVQVLTDLGIGAALIQRKDEDLTDDHYNTAFWTGIIWSCCLFLIMSFLVAPIAANFYNEPILRSLIPAISIGILLSPINMVNRSQLTKRMDFKSIARINNVTTIAAGVITLILAYFGAGVWALAFNSAAAILFAVPFYFKASGWFPKLSWNKSAFKDVFSFGMFASLTNIVNYLSNNVDYMLIGKLLNAQLLGAYTLAFILTDTFKNRIMAVMNNVMYPFYGSAQDDLAKVKRYYLKVIQWNSIIIFPIMTIFIVYGKEIVLLLWGEKWIETIIPLKILSVSVMFHMMVNSNTVLIRGLGYPKLEMNLQILKAVIFVPTLFFAVKNWGIEGAAYAVLINKIFAVILAQYTFNYLIDLKIKAIEFLGALKVPLISTSVSLVAGFLLQRIEINFILGSIVIGLLIICITWFSMKSEILDLLNQRNKGK